MRYAIGPLRLDPEARILSRAGEPLALGPRVVGTLAALVARAGEVVTKDELLDAVWEDEDVGESNVAQAIYVLRKTLREHGVANAIATVPRRGYRFVGAAIPLAASPAPARAPRPPRWSLAAAAIVLCCLALPAGSASRPAAPLGPRGAELYRLGRYFWSQRTLPAIRRSVGLFTEVTRSDPRSPLGYSGLADATLILEQYEHVAGLRVDKRRAFARARAAAERALQLGPGSAAAHTSLAMLLAEANHDRRAAEAEFRRAIALDPSYPLAHFWYGTLLIEHDRLADGERELRTAVALDPASPAANAWLAGAAYYARRFDEAIAYEERALALDPTRGDALRGLGLAYEERGDLGRAIATFRTLKRNRVWPDTAAALLAEAYARAGRRADAAAELRIALRSSPNETDTRFAEAAVAGRGRAARALAKVRAEDPLEPRLARYGAG